MIEIFQSQTFQRWRLDLRDRQAVQRINARIRRLSQGNPGDVKPIREGISELRIDYGPGYRVYFMQRGPQLSCFWPVATNALKKPTSSAPSTLLKTGETKP
jgi:putative addiction module killer protein